MAVDQQVTQGLRLLPPMWLLAPPLSLKSKVGTEKSLFFRNNFIALRDTYKHLNYRILTSP